MHGLFDILLWPLVACVSMGLLHGYAGLHVLRRGVIFVDLALAQVAALGAVVGMVLVVHPEHAAHHAATAIVAPAQAADEIEQAMQQTKGDQPDESDAEDEEEAETHGFLDFWPTAFALGGAVLLAFGRIPGERVPHEAIIGIVYVVAAAAMVLILSKSPHGHEQMEQMLTGKLLFVDRQEVLTTAVLYAVLGLLHYVFRGPFLAISSDSTAVERGGMKVRLWDCLFYAMFALMVTRSVAIGGVLVVFSFLIIPGACASMFVDSFRARVVWAWLIATAVSVCGVVISAMGDLPTGATMVASFGAALILSIALGIMIRRAAPARGGSPSGASY
jgi:zinc/manganese transport system permease protein